MKRENRPVDEKRRKFLGSAATATAATDEASQEEGKGYRLTQHVLDYYKSAAS